MNTRLFEICLGKLRDLPQVEQILPEKQDYDHDHDNKLTLQSKFDSQTYLIEIKRHIQRPIPSYLFHLPQEHYLSTLLMSEYINRSIAEELVEKNIRFVDTAGNVFITIGEKVHIEKVGYTRKQSGIAKRSSIFQPKGMQLIFVILTQKQALNFSVRQLASLANISKDTVSSALKGLLNDKFIIDIGYREFRFVNKKALFEQWLMNYGDRLRRSLHLGSFKAPPIIIQNITARLESMFGQDDAYAITGGLAADILTGYFRGPTTELFINPNTLEKIKNEFQLMPSAEPNLSFFNLFSPSVVERVESNVNIAHPLLVYSELLCHNDSRYNEAAQIIYKSYLGNAFDESQE